MHSGYRRWAAKVLFAVLLSLLLSNITAAEMKEVAPPPAESLSPLKLDLPSAVRFALNKNRQLAVYRHQPDIAKEALASAESVYDYRAFGRSGITRNNRPTISVLDTGSQLLDELEEDRWLVQAGMKKQTRLGAQISLYQEIDYLDSNSELVIPNPQNTSRLKAELRQPLLKNFGDLENRTMIEKAQLDILTAQENMRLMAANIAFDVIEAYWQLELEHSLYELHQGNMAKAEEILEKEKAKLSLGLSSALDVERAVSAIEARRSRLLNSKNRMQSASSQLHLLLSIPYQPGRGVQYSILPVQQPGTSLPEHLEITSMLAASMQHRPEIRIADNKLQAAGKKMKLAEHLQLPELNVSLSYAMNSLGEHASDAFGDAYGSEHDSWSAWLDFEYPLGNSGAEADFRKAIIEYRQAQDELLLTKDVIRQEVHAFMQDLELTYLQIGATGSAQKAAEKVLKSELANYELTRSTSKDLLTAQDQLAMAELQYYATITEFNLKIAKLSKAKGTLLRDVIGEDVFSDDWEADPKKQ